MRAAAKAKLAKTMEGDSKISLEQIKKLKLTDIFGVGVKTQEYFIENGITDMVKLSNKDVTKLTKKFIEGLPALRSFTYEMKEAKLHSIFEEAKHVVNELKNIK
jgi:nucleotidyltransferase/DNA polymerase involved in DNA repair